MRDKLKNINDCDNKKISYLKRIIVQGKADTGKSTLINEIVETVRETLGHDAIIVTAPTGAAAVNINGNTIHSKFRIPYKLTTFKDLTRESLRKFHY